MTCEAPKQLELDLNQEAEMFQQFAERVVELMSRHGIAESVCAELRNWAHFHDFPLVASWTRRLLRNLVDYRNASVLLECFGAAFRGDMVGHIGRDLIGRPLHSNNRDFRTSAINVLGRWLEYDEDGMWLEMAEEHLEREEDDELKEKLWSYITAFVDEEFLELMEEEERPDPLLEEFLEVRRGCELELKGTAPILRIKPLLCQLTGLEPSSLGPIVEYLQFPPEVDLSDVMEDVYYSYPAIKHLGILWSKVGDGRHLRVWDTLGSFAFSVEPTATEGRWLFFCYVR
jgi:hypothetical protein